MSSLSRTWLTLPMLGLLSALTACSTTRTGETKAVCAIFPPITYSSRDTPETIIQVRQHNAGRDSYCGQ